VQTSIVEEFALDAVHEFLVGEFLLLVVDHGELVCLKLVLLELHGLRDEVGQLDDLSALGIVFDGLLAHFRKLVDGLVVDLCEQLLGTQRLVANLFDALEVLGQFALVLAEIDLHLLDQLVEEHLHNGEIILELLHDLVPDVVVDEEFVLVLSEGLAVDLALLQPDVALVGYHALPLRQHQDEDLSLVQRDVEFVHREAVVDLEGEMVQKDRFVSLEQEPVLDLTDHIFLPLSLLVLLRNRLVYVLLLALVGISRLHHRYLLIVVVGQFDLLDDLLVLEVNRVHLGRHVQLVL